MSLRGGRRLCIILTLLTVQAALIAQNQPDAPPSATFQSSTQLVQARVIAEDKDGKPVTDLRQDEFQFLDNGLSQDRESLEQKLRKWKPAMDVLPEGLKVEALRREIEQIAAHVAAIPGRKNLIWVAYRFPIASPVLQKLRIADVAVYPVDAHGSVIGLKSDKALANLPLRALAAATGGVAYFDRDDLDVAIREAIDDGRSNYTLGFYPSGDDSVSLVHQITVHVTRPGITLRYRNIYQTEPPRKPAPVKAAELVQAVYSPVDTLAIPIQASARRIQDQRNGIRTNRTSTKGNRANQERLSFDIVLDVASLDLAPTQNRWTGSLEVAALFMAADRHITGTAPALGQIVKLNLSQPTYDAAAEHGVLYHNELRIPANAVEFKILIANIGTGKIGTVTIPLAEVGPAD